MVGRGDGEGRRAPPPPQLTMAHQSLLLCVLFPLVNGSAAPANNCPLCPNEGRAGKTNHL